MYYLSPFTAALSLIYLGLIMMYVIHVAYRKERFDSYHIMIDGMFIGKRGMLVKYKKYAVTVSFKNTAHGMIIYEVGSDSHNFVRRKGNTFIFSKYDMSEKDKYILKAIPHHRKPLTFLIENDGIFLTTTLRKAKYETRNRKISGTRKKIDAKGISFVST